MVALLSSTAGSGVCWHGLLVWAEDFLLPPISPRPTYSAWNTDKPRSLLFLSFCLPCLLLLLFLVEERSHCVSSAGLDPPADLSSLPPKHMDYRYAPTHPLFIFFSWTVDHGAMLPRWPGFL